MTADNTCQSSATANSNAIATQVDAATVGENCTIGPYARLREGSQIKAAAKVGNFVETN